MLLNVAGQLLPLLVAVGTIPYIIRALGIARFGVLSLALGVLGYFGVFDLGLGRATTKFVTEALRESESSKIPVVFWLSLRLTITLGVFGGCVLAALAPVLVKHVFKVPLEILGESKSVFYVLAASVPLVVMTSSARGALEAAQRFDLVNLVKAPSSALTYLIPAAVLPFGVQLPGIVLLIALSRGGALLAYLALCYKVLPLSKAPRADPALFRRLLAFGGWVSVSSGVLSMMVSLDRFLIGSLLTVSAVTYYAAPYEMVTRLWFLPISLSTALFPAFGSLTEIQDGELSRLYASAIKYLLLIMGPVVLLLMVFGRDIVLLWLGKEFAEKSGGVFQVLAFGVLLSSLAIVPQNFLQGMGRPDLTAKIYLGELAAYLGVSFFAIQHFGTFGAAIAWTGRAAADLVLLLTWAWKLAPRTLTALGERQVFRSAAALSFLSPAVLSAKIAFERSSVLEATFTSGLVILFILGAWQHALDAEDRNSLLSFWGRPVRLARRAK